jgi:membrane protease YdiL (CAAX protease family)
MIDYPPPEPDLPNGIVSIAVVILVFLIYYFTGFSEKLRRRMNNAFPGPGASIRIVLCQRLTGAVLFGIIPFMILTLVFRKPLSQYGFASDFILRSILWWLPVTVLVILVSFLWAGHRKNLEMYPQIRVNQWSSGLLVVSALSWITYLIGYEFMFRGFLLFSCLESFGFWPAIIINLGMYSLAHVHKGLRETIGSVFVGFLFCYPTLYLESIWFALLAHITMALSNEWFSLRRQPHMKLISKIQSK